MTHVQAVQMTVFITLTYGKLLHRLGCKRVVLHVVHATTL